MNNQATAKALGKGGSQIAIRDPALGITPIQLKASKGHMQFLVVSHLNTVPVYIQLKNALAADITVGVTVPMLSIFIPASDGTVPAAYELPSNLPGIHFNTAITVWLSTDLDGSGAAPEDALLNTIINA